MGEDRLAEVEQRTLAGKLERTELVVAAEPLEDRDAGEGQDQRRERVAGAVGGQVLVDRDLDEPRLSEPRRRVHEEQQEAQPQPVLVPTHEGEHPREVDDAPAIEADLVLRARHHRPASWRRQSDA
ncbi:MAG: hypothetical protein O3B85_02675 [Planctomycetota bacterium]|nr:hypothetical protein [Planctomycetota bacterium]